MLNFDNVNWLYVGLAVAAWVVLVVVIWRNPNESHVDQWLRFSRENSDLRVNYEQWLHLPFGPKAPVQPGRLVPIIQLSVVFWVLLVIVTLAVAARAP